PARYPPESAGPRSGVQHGQMLSRVSIHISRRVGMCHRFGRRVEPILTIEPVMLLDNCLAACARVAKVIRLSRSFFEPLLSSALVPAGPAFLPTAIPAN